MMQDVLVFGSAGMAGHVICEYLEELGKYNIIRCARSSGSEENVMVVDVRNPESVKSSLKEVKPDIVINCAGLLIQASEERIDEAVLVNSYVPQYLAWLGREQKFKLIHLSTDCIFSGEKGGYVESDRGDGCNAYARTRALGEVVSEDHLTIRTSFVGPELKSDGSGLFGWFMQQKGEISGFSNAFWSGVTTLELSKFIDAAIEADLRGLYQLTAPNKISKFELLNYLKDAWQKDDVVIKKHDNAFSDKSLVSTRTDFQWQVSEYPTMFNQLKVWMDSHPELYKA